MNRAIATLTFCCLLSTAAPLAAQTTDPAMVKDIYRLLELTGALKLGEQMASMFSTQILNAMKAGMPNLPDRAVQVINEVTAEEFKTAFAPDGEMVSGFVKVYAQHFTAEDIRGLIAFYESPLGRKVTATLPAVMQESMVVGSSWGERHAPEIQRRIQTRLKAEGLIK